MSVMDWGKTPERRALSEAIAQMCAADDPSQALIDAGIAWIGLDESLGGSGGVLADAAVAVRVLALQSSQMPAAETAIAAGWVLAVSGLQIPTTWLAPVLDPRDELTLTQHSSGNTINGIARDVPALGSADILVVCVDTHVCVVKKNEIDIQWSTNVAGEGRGTLEFKETPVLEIAALPDRFTKLDCFARLAFARAIQLSGALTAIRDLSVDYAKTREQFGKPIASLQVIAHYLAELAELALIGEGAIATAIANPNSVNFAIAKSVTGRAAREATRIAHQIHGAMGMSQEYALGAYTTSMWAWTEEAGRPEFWNTYLGTSFLAQADRNLWASITDGMEGEQA